jgi:hypothetical protein
MNLTRDNYYQYLQHEGVPLMTASTLRYAYPGQGGSLAMLTAFFLQQSMQEDDEEKKHQRLGKLLHRWIENHRQFIVSPDDRPDDWICKVVDRAFPLINDFRSNIEGPIADSDLLSEYPDIISRAREGIQGNWKDETVIKKVIQEGAVYYQFLRAAEGKLMINADDRARLEGMQNSIQNSDYAEVLLEKKVQDGQVFTEVPVLWQYTGLLNPIWCKSMIDQIKVFPGRRQIWIDEHKTTSKPVNTFMSTAAVGINCNLTPYQIYIPGPAYTYRYYRQLSFYRDAALAFLEPIFGPEVRSYEINYGYYAIGSEGPYEIAYLPEDIEAIIIGFQEIEQAMRVHEQYLSRLNRSF